MSLKPYRAYRPEDDYPQLNQSPYSSSSSEPLKTIDSKDEKPERIMRAKMKLGTMLKDEYGERLHFDAVCKNGQYPDDGLDEDNTYAKFTPSGEVNLYVANEALFGKLIPGKKYYVDFTEAPETEK